MKYIKIMMDIDGVLSDFNTGYGEILKNTLNIKLPPHEKITEWDFTLCIDGLDREKEEKIWSEIKTSPNFWKNLSAYEENVDALTEACYTYPFSHKLTPLVYYVTTRPDEGNAYMQTYEWLQKRNLVNTQSFAGLIFSDKKSKVVEAIKTTYALDDKVSNLEKIDRNTCSCRLLTRPWNIEFPNTFKRVKSVRDFFELILKREGEKPSLIQD